MANWIEAASEATVGLIIEFLDSALEQHQPLFRPLDISKDDRLLWDHRPFL